MPPERLHRTGTIFAIDQYFERPRHIPQWNRREPCARETHVFQFAGYATSIIVNQQADRAADLVARVDISSVFIASIYNSTIVWMNRKLLIRLTNGCHDTKHGRYLTISWLDSVNVNAWLVVQVCTYRLASLFAAKQTSIGL